jgi:hypothetical protein
VTDVADIQPLMDRAEQAAHSGDFAAAEEALRLAIELQERTLGASSPEVASTLNNLGIVYERLNRPTEAEACYRKSFAIAKAAFAGNHPLVETSATNLREFCDARGIEFERPEPEPDLEPAPVSPPIETPTAAAPSRPAREVPPAPAVATSSPSSLGQIVLGVAVIVAVVAGIFLWSHRAAPPLPSPAPSSAAIPPAPVVEPETAPAQAPAPVATPPAAVSEPVSKPSPPPVSPQTAPPRTAASVAVEALDSRLCQALDLESNWHCEPLPESAVSGPVFFVTRLKSAADTSVEHRWYRNDKLSQSVTLHVRATGSGYRTYSRMTASRDRPGTWRVEVRDPGGAVLDSKTFVVGPS